MVDRSAVAAGNTAALSQQEPIPAWINAVALPVWLLAAAVAFIPFARGTSPWDAVTLRVPGNQGNWWHMLVGAPFFLAYPMLWLRLRPFLSRRRSTAIGRRPIWIAVGVSICGTLLVETPFLLHLAGTSNWQRLAVLSLGFGILLASGLLLLLHRHRIAPARACIVGLNAAYLANAALCLVVYSEAAGSAWSRAGWLISMVLVWPMILDLGWLLLQTGHAEARQINRLSA